MEVGRADLDAHWRHGIMEGASSFRDNGGAEKGCSRTAETIHIEGIALQESQLQHIRELPHVFEAEYDQSQCLLTVKCTSAEHNLVRLLNYLQGQQVAFHQVYSQLPTLNDVFLEITGKELRD